MKRIFNWFIEENSKDVIRILILPLLFLFMIYYKWISNNTEVLDSISLSVVIFTFICFFIMLVYINKFLVSRMKYFFDIIMTIFIFVLFFSFFNSLENMISLLMLILLALCLAISIVVLLQALKFLRFTSIIGKIFRRLSILDDYISLFLSTVFCLTIYVTCFDNEFILYSILIFYTVFFTILLYNASEKNYETVDISFLNLDYLDIIKNKIYICAFTLKNFNDVRIFKIDVSKLFPEDSENHFVAITNYNYIDKYVETKTNEENNSNKSMEYVYFALDKRRVNDNVRIRFFITYTLKKGNNAASSTPVNENLNSVSPDYENIDKKSGAVIKKELLDLYVKVKLMDDELCITHQEIMNHHNAFLKNIYNHALYIGSYPLEKLFFRSYMYNYDLNLENEYNLLNANDITGKRKWLLHEGEFGCGKTTLDILTVLNAGCIPVVISPWEENYDIDILALIFKRVTQASKKKFYKIDSSTMLFFLVALAGFFYFIQKIFLYLINKLPTQIFDNLYVNTYSKLITFMNETLCEVFLNMLIEIASLGIAVLLALHLLPRVIIYMKDLTKVHQDYYIKNIVKMLQKENIIMIIEDMDRLNEKVAENVFRTLSAINHQCIMHYKIIGIMSFYINSEEENYKTTPSNTILEDLENKVIYRNILDSYNSEESKKEYFKNLFHLIITLYIENCKLKDLENDIELEIKKLNEAVESLDFHNMNFRDVRDILEKFAENLHKYYLTQSIIISFSNELLNNLGYQDTDYVVNA